MVSKRDISNVTLEESITPGRYQNLVGGAALLVVTNQFAGICRYATVNGIPSTKLCGPSVYDRDKCSLMQSNAAQLSKSPGGDSLDS